MKRPIALVIALAFFGFILYQYIQKIGLPQLAVLIFVVLLVWWALGVLCEWYVERRNKK